LLISAGEEQIGTLNCTETISQTTICNNVPKIKMINNNIEWERRKRSGVLLYTMGVIELVVVDEEK
jgi:hypothetical protein